MIKSSFPSFFDRTPLFESVQQAKDYLIKRYALAHHMKTSEVPEETKKEILSDPKFVEIRDLTAKSPGYTPMFVKFAYEQNATMEHLREILDLLSEYKQTLKQDLPMNVNDYQNIVPSEDDIRPGYEVLADDLRAIERKRRLRKLYSEMTKKMRHMFLKATEEQVNKLEEISNQLDQLPDKKDEETGKVANAWRGFSSQMRKYEDTLTYPAYRDPEVAFNDMIKDGEEFIKAWNITEDERVKELKALGPQIGWIYNKNKYIGISTRTSEALRAIAGDTGWCIRNDSTFWSYGGGRVQLVIMNNNLPVTDVMSLVGITVNPDGTIHTDADRPNRRITNPSGGTYRTLNALLKDKYPQDLVDAFDKKFKREADIKLALEKFFRQGRLSSHEIILALLQTSKASLAGDMSEEDWEQISGTVAQIISEERSIKVTDFLKEFRESGIFSEAAMRVFDRIIGTNYTKEDIEQIIKSTKNGLEDMEYIIELASQGIFDKKGQDISDEKRQGIETLKDIISHKNELIKRIESKL